MYMTNDIINYFENSYDETVDLITELSGIPAPSNHEEKRAKFCKNWLENAGAKGVYIDEALNVLYPVNCDGSDDIVLFLAHTDTVFPDTEPMNVTNDGTYIHSPGVGDDTTCLAVLMKVAEYVCKNKLERKGGVLFAANAAEEGLGNLKGIKQIMKDYEGRIKEVYSFDCHYTHIINKCVGSHRYEITLETTGGHSFNNFGNKNAIHAASELICRLYNHEVPKFEDSITTYNVGIIEGGTSVNTIAQSVKMLYEYRSDNKECLEKMKSFFENEIECLKQDKDVKVTVKTAGVRPCSEKVDEAVFEKMVNKAIGISEKHSGEPCVPRSGSTDCNIPMSLGVPAICVGNYIGFGAHTREEKVLLSSIPVGLKITAELVLSYFDDREEKK